jgi:hypothetical protein
VVVEETCLKMVDRAAQMSLLSLEEEEEEEKEVQQVMYQAEKSIKILVLPRRTISGVGSCPMTKEEKEKEGGEEEQKEEEEEEEKGGSGRTSRGRLLRECGSVVIPWRSPLLRLVRARSWMEGGGGGGTAVPATVCART